MGASASRMSGGLDSLLVADAARAVAEGREIHTIATGYGPDDPSLAREARTARAVGSRHHTVILDPAEIDSLLPWMVWHLEEPSGGIEVAYLFAGAREAARHVTVAVTGVGLGEFLGGAGTGRLAGGALGDLLRRPLSALKAAYHRGNDFPPARLRGAAPLPRLAGAASNALQRLRMQASIERLFSGLGIRLAAPSTDPVFVDTALSLPGTPGPLAPGGGFTRGDRLTHRTRMADALDRMAVELLSPGAVRERGFFEPAYLAGLLRRSRGQPYGEDRARRIWSLLLIEIWARGFLDRRGAPPDHPAPPIRLLDAAGAPRSAVTTGAT